MTFRKIKPDRKKKIQANVCSESHDLLIKSMNLSNTAILNTKGSDYAILLAAAELAKFRP